MQSGEAFIFSHRKGGQKTSVLTPEKCCHLAEKHDKMSKIKERPTPENATIWQEIRQGRIKIRQKVSPKISALTLNKS
jgi:hypothetical protein